MEIPPMMSQLSRKEYFAKIRWCYTQRGREGKTVCSMKCCPGGLPQHERREGALSKAQMPVRTDDHDIVESDNIAPSSGSLLGDLVWSVNLAVIVSLYKLDKNQRRVEQRPARRLASYRPREKLAPLHPAQRGHRQRQTGF